MPPARGRLPNAHLESETLALSSCLLAHTGARGARPTNASERGCHAHRTVCRLSLFMRARQRRRPVAQAVPLPFLARRSSPALVRA